MRSERPCVLNHNLGNLITASILSSKQAVELNLREMLPVSSQSHFILLQHCWQSAFELNAVNALRIYYFGRCL